jgi:hypothetical protein
MPERLAVDDAHDVLQELVTSERDSTGDVASALRAFERFASISFQVGDLPDSDGLLFQYGVFSFTGRPMFTLSLTRQFEQYDDHGEHESFRQVGVEILYMPDAALSSLERKESWCFAGPGSSSAAEWFAEIRSAPLFQIIERKQISSLAIIDEFS